MTLVSFILKKKKKKEKVKNNNFFHNYFTWQIVIDCTSYSHGPITFSLPLTIWHMNSYVKSCGLLHGLRIFVLITKFFFFNSLCMYNSCL